MPEISGYNIKTKINVYQMSFHLNDETVIFAFNYRST